jgi:spore coat polysaccharide biosynthesis protein SpsF
MIKKINNKSTLEYLLERVKKCKNIDDIIVCTTVNEIDNTICDICESTNIKYYRGDENNVLSRYYESACLTRADNIVRVTGDCTLIDSQIIDNLVEEFKKSGADFMDPNYYGEGKGAVAGFPDGSNPEIFTFKALQEANSNAITSEEKEHVSGYIIKNLLCKKYNIPINLSLYNNLDFKTLHLSLDTLEDFMLIEKIINNLYTQNNDFTIYDVLEFLNKI